MRTPKPAHIARHAAIVLAGAASLSLTVVAGAYIVHQIADTQRPSGPVAAPIAAPATEFEHETVRVEPVLTSGRHALPAPRLPRLDDSADPASKPAGPQTDSTRTARDPGIGGRLLFGETYLGARLAAGPAESISFTVDTNAVTVLAGFLPSDPRRATTGDTRLCTEFDTRSGAVVFLLTDPTLGAHDLRLEDATQPDPEQSIDA